MRSRLAALVAALAVVVALAGFGRASAQNTIVGRGQAVTTVRGSLVLIADGQVLYAVDARTQQSVHEITYWTPILDLDFDDGYLAVTMDDIVLIESIGDDGEHLGDLKTVGKVPGPFIKATVAGDMLAAIDRQGKLWYLNWRSGEAAAPDEGHHHAYLPFVQQHVFMGGPAPTPRMGEPTPMHGPEPTRMPPPGGGPTVPPMPLLPTLQPCGYPPCNAAEVARLRGR